MPVVVVGVAVVVAIVVGVVLFFLSERISLFGLADQIYLFRCRLSVGTSFGVGLGAIVGIGDGAGFTKRGFKVSTTIFGVRLEFFPTVNLLRLRRVAYAFAEDSLRDI